MYTQKQKYRKDFLKILKKKRGFNIRDKILNAKLKEMITNFILPTSYKYIDSKMHIKYIENKKKFINILLYMNLDFEVNLSYLINSLRGHKRYRLFIPKCDKNSFKINFIRLPLKKQGYNIKECIGSRAFEYERIDIGIIPVLGVDKHYKRIGFGKGMYDRFFTNILYKPRLIFISRIKNIAKEKLGNDFDVHSKKYIGLK